MEQADISVYAIVATTVGVQSKRPKPPARTLLKIALPVSNRALFDWYKMYYLKINVGQKKQSSCMNGNLLEFDLSVEICLTHSHIEL